MCHFETFFTKEGSARKRCVCLHWFSSHCVDTCCSCNSGATVPDTWSSNFSSYICSSWFLIKYWRLCWSERNFLLLIYIQMNWKKKESLYFDVKCRVDLLKSICTLPWDRFWNSSFPGWCQHDTCTMTEKMLSIPLLQKIQLTHLKHEET